jgi:hypothetical protein
MRISEESSAIVRGCLACVGGLNMRPLKLHVQDRPGFGSEGDAPAPSVGYVIEKPCQCGAWICCPWKSTLRDSEGRVVGSTRENFSPYPKRCVQLCCLCTSFTDLMRHDPQSGRAERRYTMRSTMCCCGRVNNFCGATCCRNDMIQDVLDPDTGEVVSTVQKTFAPSGGGPCGGGAACCRCMQKFSNYILDFPEDADHEDRMLIVSGVMAVDYQLHEKPGGDK